MLKETQGTQKQYDLLVTDMNYPLKKGGVSDGQAGEKTDSVVKRGGDYDSNNYFLNKEIYRGRGAWKYMV